MMITLHHHCFHVSTTNPSSTAAFTTSIIPAQDASSSCSLSYTPAPHFSQQEDPANNKTPIQLLQGHHPHATTAFAVEAQPASTGKSTDLEPIESFSTRLGFGKVQHLQQQRPNPLAISELVQEICSYFDRRTLIRACHISRRFLACCSPLLWADIPEHAWTNDYFRAHWQLHASKIRTLCCAPGTDLLILSLYCQNLVSLDVSKVSVVSPDSISCKERGLRPLSRQQQQQQMQSQRVHVHENLRAGHPSTLHGCILSRDICVNKQTDSRALHNNDNNNLNTCSNTVHSIEAQNPYNSFIALAKDLAKVLLVNRNLQCLQFKPYSRLPHTLLDAMTRLPRLQILSLNGWDDFQEYSLQLVLESCPQLSHLSLGENDFTQFSLDSFSNPYTSPASLGAPTAEMTKGVIVKLERYDDPIKGGHGSSVQYVDQDLLDIQSKRPVLYRPSSPLSAAFCDPPLQRLSTYKYRSTALYQLRNHEISQSTPLGNRLQSLSLHQSGLRQDFLVNLTSQCPRLQHLSLLDGWGFYPSSRFAAILSESCPNLQRLEFRQQAIDLQDEFFVSLCTQFPGLRWIHAGKTGFSQRGLDAVRMSCHSIVSLNLDGTRGIQSRSLDLLLRTCATLQSLRAEGVVLNGHDLVKNSKWACLGLRTLVIDIEIWVVPGLNSESLEDVRSRVYDHLSDLTRLKILGLGGGHRVRGSLPGVDLTLESGLDKLARLQCLEQLHIRSLFRAIGVNDMKWMVANWPRFWRLDVGKCPVFARNRGGDNTNKAVEWLAQSRPGIDIRIY